jgi:hypothetical protein
MGGGGDGDGGDGGPLAGVARAAVVVGGLTWCLDSATTGPYGGYRAEKRKRQRGGEAEDRLDHRHKHGGKRPRVLGLGFNPNRYNKNKTNKKDHTTIRSEVGKAQGPE